MALTENEIGERLKQARKSAQLSQQAAATAIGIDRTALVKIEKGTRSISSVELYKLAHLYRRDPSDFLETAPLQDDPFTTFGRIYKNAELDWNEDIAHNLEVLKEAVRVKEYLPEQAVTTPPKYQLPLPGCYEQAVDQGKEIAILERERLKLGSTPIHDIASIIAEQGIWTAAVPFPKSISGLFIAHNRYGLAIFVNQEHARVRRRFSYAHEYAHALIDRDRKEAEPTSLDNRNDFIEKRANAFASEFLIPATGVYEMLERTHKGEVSQASSWIWDAATNEAIHHNVQGNRLARKIRAHDVALLADEYTVSYDAAAIRLKDINAIKQNQLQILLKQKQEGMKFLDALKCFNPSPEPDSHEQPYLVRQLIILSIEAFQREKISTGRFREICELVGVPYQDLMPIANAGMSE